MGNPQIIVCFMLSNNLSVWNSGYEALKKWDSYCHIRFVPRLFAKREKKYISQWAKLAAFSDFWSVEFGILEEFCYHQHGWHTSDRKGGKMAKRYYHARTTKITLDGILREKITIMLKIKKFSKPF
jgi:hypothetical protein